jgi:hypothetical protein
MKLRIHHFYDIIRDFGVGNPITPHPYGHSYHLLAREIWENSSIPIQLVLACDAICLGCNKIINENCTDTISHRQDFSLKQAFNNHIDSRIMNYCSLNQTEIYTPRQLCQVAGCYSNNKIQIYEGNDLNHTTIRHENFMKGLELYATKHNFKLLL